MTTSSKAVTQISGKYSHESTLVLTARRNLVAAGISVRHPMSSQFISEVDGVAYTFDVYEKSIAEVEADLFRCIAACSFHTLCNRTPDHGGYIGHSASIETSAALLHSKPVVALSGKLSFGQSVQTRLAEILERNSERFATFDFCQAPPQSTDIEAILRIKPRYELEDSDSRYIEALIASHLRGFSSGVADGE